MSSSRFTSRDAALRRPSHRAAVFALLILLPLCGCAGTAPLDPDALRARLPELAAAAAADPSNLDALADYGVALHLMGRHDDAAPVLERALAGGPERPDAALALGRIRLAAGDLDAAEQCILRARARDDDEQALLQSFRARIEHDRLVIRMRELARNEQAIAADRIPEGTIGVLDFTTDGAPDKFQGLGKAITAVMTTELTRLPELRVVERQQLQVLLQEIQLVKLQGVPLEEALDPVSTVRGLQQRLATLRNDDGPFYAGIVDGVPGPGTTEAVRSFQRWRGLSTDGIPGPKTAAALEEAARQHLATHRVPAPAVTEGQPGPRAGRLIGARRILSGNIAAASEDDLRVQSQLVDSEDGSIVVDATIERPLVEFHRIPGELVVQTADGIGLPLDDRTRRALLNAPPVTRSLAAFLAFGRGLDYEDRGLWEDAAAEYANAVRLSPGFDLARKRIEVVRIGSPSFQQSLQRGLQSAAKVIRAGSGVAGRAMGAVGAETTENDVRDDSGNLDRAVQADGTPPGTIRVTGQIPVR